MLKNVNELLEHVVFTKYYLKENYFICYFVIVQIFSQNK